MTAPNEICQSGGGTITPGSPCHLSPPADAMGLADWQYLINFRPPAAVKSSIHKRLHQEAFGTPDYHAIEGGAGAINLDFYPVYLDQLPTIDGVQLTPQEVLTYFRKNLSSFMDTSKVTFGSYDTEDYVKWQSDDPIGSVMRFHMGLLDYVGTTHIPLIGDVVLDTHAQGESWMPLVNPENAGVVASEITSDHWIFATLWTPKDQNHPVSGSRQFGVGTRCVTDTYSSTYDRIFSDPLTQDIPFVYMRGADRCTTIPDWIVCGKIFDGANACWSGACKKLQAWVNSNGGRASIPGCISNRYDWDAVKAVYWQNPPL